MKKRLLLVLLALAAAVSLCVGLAACGGPDSGEEPGPGGTPEFCTVIYDANGGTFEDGSSSKEQVVRYNQPAPELADTPTRDGYLFGYWSLNGERYDFKAPITEESVTLRAEWESQTLEGAGTADDPYIIASANDLVKMQEAVFTAGGDYLSAHYEVTADIDASEVSFMPVGSSETPFTGEFDGGEHTISGLKIDVSYSGSENADLFAGFFGYTYLAKISNISFENMEVSVNARSSATIYAGTAAGYADVTSLTNISASGSISVQALASDPVYAGGITGAAASEVNDENQALLVILRGLQSSVTFSAAAYSGSFENTVIGGIVGGLSSAGGAVALADCVNTADIAAVSAAGGIAGAASGGMVTITNCFNSGNMNASSSASASYAGGIVGQITGDSILTDCVSTGKVIAAASASAMYKSRAGAVAGYMTPDDYSYYFTQGAAAVNCYYTQAASCPDGVESAGEQISASEVTDAFLKEELGWSSVVLTDSGAEVQLQPLAESYKVTLHNGQSTETKTVPAQNVVGMQDDVQMSGGKLFFGWSLKQDGYEGYRYYMPLFKDIELYAYGTDVSAIAGNYSTGEDGQGTLVLEEDGTLKLITDVSDTGWYKYDGENFIAYLDSYFGDFCGTVDGDTITFTIAYGMNDYTFQFSRYEPLLLGEYLNTANGQFLTFSGQETAVLNTNGTTTKLTYKQTSDGWFTLAKSTGQTAAMIQQEGNNFRVRQATDTQLFTQNDVFSSVEELTGDYAELDFLLGEWNFFYTSNSDDVIYGAPESFIFDENGVCRHVDTFSTDELRYFYIEGKGIMLVGDYISWFYYDGDSEVLYGDFAIGTSSTKFLLCVREDLDMLYGTPAVAVSDYSTAITTYILEAGGKYYIVADGAYDKTAKWEGDLVLGGNVTLTVGDKAVSYVVTKGKAPYVNEETNVIGYSLTPVGEEKGSYTNGLSSIILDGIGGVTGSKAGTYYVNGTVITVVFDDDSIINFDYEAARAADGVIEVLETDGFEGVYYYNDGSSMNKFVITGTGMRYGYYYSSDYEAYRLNWPGAAYTVTTPISVTGKLGSTENFVFVMLDKNNFVCNYYGSQRVYTKDGATPLQPVSIDRQFLGTFVNGSDTLTIVSETEAIYNGQTVAAAFRSGEYYFRLNGKDYACTLNANGTITLDGRSFTRQGGAPAEGLGLFVGTWTSDDGDRIVINDNNTLTMNDSTHSYVFDEAKMTVSFGNPEENYYVLTYNEDEGTLTLEIFYEGMTSGQGPETLTKVA